MMNPNGVVSGNSQNIPEANTPRTRSTFPLHYHFFNTHRFGEYIPHFVAEMNKDEKFPIHSSHDLRSYTLESPLMQSVKRNKDYFLVPMEAILPLNWEKFFDNPVRGDDVLDDVGPSVENFWSKVSGLMSSLRSSLITLLGNTQSDSNEESMLQACFRFFIIGEYFYSSGNLLSSLGCHGSPYFDALRTYGGVATVDNEPYLFDDWFDDFCKLVNDCLVYDPANGLVGSFELVVDGNRYTVSNAPSGGPLNSISLRHALQLMRDNPTFSIQNMQGANLSGQNNVWQSFSKDALALIQSPYTVGANIFVSASIPLNLSRLWAYQLCCAHYFSNDHIDFVYSAELYRQLIGNYLISMMGGSLSPSMFFSRNGSTYQYDYLSAHALSFIFSWSATSPRPSSLLTSINNNQFNSVLGYLSALFGYRRSLRYLDYFTGSRSQPLAVVNTNQINTNVAVNNNQVSVIDISKSIQAQRFLNSVNRVRHNFEGYLKGIFGGSIPSPDYHNPFYLAHTDDVIFGQETENTASEQMNDKIAITTNLRSHSGNYMFEIDSDRPCIAIGITSYDITRIYDKTIERPFFHQNRFDWFNPFMQYIGDQPIYLQELGIKPSSSSLNALANFSYTLRHMEYKQRYSQCSGGFCVPSTDLDQWLFIAKDRRGNQSSINPDWIRSLNAEFDKFYVSLTGYSLGTYFHFIVDDYNSCNASRPMAFAPQIL